MARGQIFPITEVFGYATEAGTHQSGTARATRGCPFNGVSCEKYRQYGFGYCSVTYAAADDARTQYTYAVCDHRLDGPPVAAAVADHFDAQTDIRLVPEIVLANPRASFDYVAFRKADTELDDIIAIETQSIDLRGGGVGPAWRAWADGKPQDWRRYFTEEAHAKNRRDTVDYGVNMANIYKRLGTQVAEKGTYLKSLAIPFYVVMQDRPFAYLLTRIPFESIAPGAPWDIAFMTFDYTGEMNADGTLVFGPVRTVRTTLAAYVQAMSKNRRLSDSPRQDFINLVKRKARL